jgi:hypothetical protein
MMFNENGVAYAPWLSKQVDEDAILEGLIKKELQEKGITTGTTGKAKTILDRGEIESSEGMRWRMSGDQVRELISICAAIDIILYRLHPYGSMIQSLLTRRLALSLYTLLMFKCYCSTFRSSSHG